MKKDGGVAAPLQHAFDQVRSWLDAVRRNWAATIECMGFEPDEVASVSGLVIAGRDGRYQAEHLSRLKGTDWGTVDCFTYDDLLNGAVTLVRSIEEL